MTVNYCLRRAKTFYSRNLAIHHEDRRITYAEFYRLVEDSARKLVTMGAGEGDRVALLMLNSPEYLELYYSCAMAGAVIVPLNTRWHINEIIYTLTDSGSKILFVDERFAQLSPQLRKALPALEHIVYADDGTCPADLLDWKTVTFDHGIKSFPEPDENDLFGLFF